MKDSLAGRVGKIRLRGLTQGEISGTAPCFLPKAFAGEFPAGAVEPFRGRDEIFDMALRGGFPEVLDLKDKDRKSWHVDYVEALLENDLRDIQRIQRHNAMRNLVRVLAAWSGKYMDIADIGAGLSVKRPTLESYINALEFLYIAERLPPWTKTDYARAGKKDKIYMCDSGLMASILEWTPDQARMDSDRAGKLIETFVFNELAAQIDASDRDYKFFQYRDREKREIDFIVENANGDILGIEVKFGSSVQKQDFRHLRWFKDHLAGERDFTGIVLYTGEHCGSFGEQIWAVPISTLWSHVPVRYPGSRN